MIFWISIFKSAWLLKADVEEKDNRIFKGEGEEKSCRRVHNENSLRNILWGLCGFGIYLCAGDGKIVRVSRRV